MRRILVATAGGPCAELAVQIAISQARQYIAETGETSEITLLNVVSTEADDVVIDRAERMLTDIASHYDYPLSKQMVQVDDVVMGIAEESEKHGLHFIGATGEGLFEQRLLGSIPQCVAREAPTTVTMTRRYWRLKSLVGYVRGCQ